MDWKTIARTNPEILKWYSQLPESKNGTDIVDLMNYQKKQGIYDYQKAIEQGISPSFQPEHGQMRWSDIGKLANNPNLQNQDSPLFTEKLMKIMMNKRNLDKSL